MWTLSFSGKGNAQYNGTLVIAQPASYNSFTGHIDLSFKENGILKDIREEALITINGSKITISCSDPKFLTESGNYTADYFDFTLTSHTEAEGDDVDDKNVHYHATLRRR
jgi:2',3'-cyclic-nucleotide 2'-phosphodiesterase (5'-nucleotidase family)